VSQRATVLFRQRNPGSSDRLFLYVHDYDGALLDSDPHCHLQETVSCAAAIRERICRGKRAMNITKNLGILLLAIYLILEGILRLFNVGIGAIVLGVLAAVTGILILVGK
jgi:hypothetical protein